MTDYWNHNSAYHPELLEAVPRRDCRVLDVGCGDGLLLQKLSMCAKDVTGIDTDEVALRRARERLIQVANVRTIAGDLLTSPELDGQHFELITCVAALHHMPLVPALERMRDLLAPGGELRIVGLAANRTLADWVLAGLLSAPIRLASMLHNESDYPGMTTATPRESHADIRSAASRVLPGSRLRRRFYYRYTLDWTKPQCT